MFATAIHADVPFAGLHDYLRRELACWGLGLDADGFITDPYRGPDGIYAVVPPEEYEGRPWHHAVHPCPFVGPLVGYLRWETWEDMWFNSDFPRALFRAGRGTTARIEDGCTADAIALRHFSLSCVFGKWSFDDGDALLTRDDGAYQDYVIETVRHAIQAAGLTAHVGWMSTCHNPLRLGWFQAAGSEGMVPALWNAKGEAPRLVDPDSALADLSVALWTYDFERLRDRDFWTRSW